MATTVQLDLTPAMIWRPCRQGVFINDRSGVRIVFQRAFASSLARCSVILLLALQFSLCLAAGNALADSIPVYDVGSEDITLKQFKVYVIEDPSRSLSIDDIASGTRKGSLMSSRFYIRSSEVDYWFVFRLKNSSRMNINRIVRFDEPNSDEANIYYREKGEWFVAKSGLSEPIAQRTIQNRNPVFSLSIPPGQSRIIYLKLHSKYQRQTIGIHVGSPAVYLYNEQVEVAGYSFYFGAACALILYNVFLLISLRERLYAYYVLQGVCFVLFVLLYSGFDLYAGVGESWHYMLESTSGLGVAFFTLFARNLLQAWKNLPKIIDKSLVLIASIMFGVAAAIIIDIRNYQYLVMAVPIVYFYLLMVGVYAWIKRRTLSNYYVFGMGIYLGGIIMAAALNSVYMPYNLVTRHFYLFGSLSELVIFSLALAYRVKLLQKKNVEYQRKLVNTERNAKRKLETLVLKRTVELRKVNQKLALLSQVDGLTGIYNRRVFNELMLKEWRRLQRSGDSLCLVMCDVDFFKSYNDTYGHQAGDDCLKMVANSIQSVVRRSNDIPARYGGEEFGIILPMTDAEGGEMVSEKIRMQIQSLNIPHRSSALGCVTLSFGVAAMVPNDNDSPEVLVQMADHALYQSKNNGRNRVTVSCVASNVA